MAMAAECLNGFDEERIAALNAIAKVERAPRPFGDIHFVSGHGGWWAECPTTGKGFWYGKLEEAVSRWAVVVVSASGGVLLARPA